MTSDLCRICLEKGAKTNLFQITDSGTTSSKIMSIAKVYIHPNDGLPSSICVKCLRKLNKCFQFVHQVENSDRTLRSLLLSSECIELDITKSDLKLNIFDTEQTSNETNISNHDVIPIEYEDKKEIKCEISSQDSNEDKKTKNQQCFKCGKVMSSRFRLKTHLRTHTGEKPFTCVTCHKTFTLEQNLKVHMRIHTGEKPLRCNICGASFAQSAGLAAHKRKHTGQTPYKCMLCTRSFRTWGHLQYHVRRHTGEKNFECDTCGRAFITRSDMKQHIRTHTGEKPHVCCICGLRVARASHLKRHMLSIHSGKIKYTCSICSENFTKKSEYELHRKKHIEEKEPVI